jgi:hypothetical protein
LLGELVVKLLIFYGLLNVTLKACFSVCYGGMVDEERMVRRTGASLSERCLHPHYEFTDGACNLFG